MWYVADFETTSEETYKIEGETRVWLWAICDSNADMVGIGTDIASFLEKCRELNHATIYFHNLKFDGTFILDYLLRNGYEHFREFPKNCTKGVKTLIDDSGLWYSIRLLFTRTTYVTFLDSLKLLPYKAEKIAEDFNLPISKLKIDYSDYTITPEKIAYITNDVRIIALALKELKDENLTKMTIASCAYNAYKSRIYNTWFNLCNPSLPTEFLTEWRAAYRGGRSQVNPIYKNMELRNVRRYDINSMYPYIMSNCDLPYGTPIECSYPNDYKFSLVHCRIGFYLKEGHIPTLLMKNSRYGDDSYYVSTEDVEEMWISSIDLELVYRHYDVYYFELIKCYGFYCSRIQFGEYISHWYKKKQEYKGAKKQIAKLMLNSLYGKFGSNVMRKESIPFLSESDSISLSVTEPEESTHYYLPKAIAIVSWAHKLIDDAIMVAGYDNFVYCDTDSVHILSDLPSDMIHSTKLGKFKLEATELRSKYLRQKCYLTYEQKDSTELPKWHLTVAGMPQNSKDLLIETYGDSIINFFTYGLTVSGKLIPKRVKGGTILHETNFTIKA